jgi:hypothetical protein
VPLLVATAGRGWRMCLQKHGFEMLEAVAFQSDRQSCEDVSFRRLLKETDGTFQWWHSCPKHHTEVPYVGPEQYLQYLRGTKHSTALTTHLLGFHGGCAWWLTPIIPTTQEVLSQPRQKAYEAPSQPIKIGCNACLSFHLCHKHKQEDRGLGHSCIDVRPCLKNNYSQKGWRSGREAQVVVCLPSKHEALGQKSQNH